MRKQSLLFGILVVLVCLLAAARAIAQADDLINAARDGDLPRVKALLAKGTGVNAKLNNGLTALIQASQNGHLEVVETLLWIAKGVSQGAKKAAKAFQEQAEAIAQKFAQGGLKATDVAFHAGIRQAGMTVKPTLSAAVQREADKAIRQNVKLIKSIGREHEADVRALVTKSIQSKQSATQLAQALERRYDITERRAALIARDQNNKATAAIHRALQLEHGIDRARWIHTAASKVPREEHMAWDEQGATYKISEGMYSEVDGEFVWPGTLHGIESGGSSKGLRENWSRHNECINNEALLRLQ